MKNDFPILKQTIYGKPLVYLDNAATTQKPQCVIESINYAYSHFNANIHRGVHYLSRVATEEHEKARKAVAEFISAKSEKEIIFSKGTTDSINMLAWSLSEKENFLQEGDEIIISSHEHHSNIVPWQMLCKRKKTILKVIPIIDDLSLDIEAYKNMLSHRTKFVSIAHVSNLLGLINPVEEIIRLAHEVGALVCVDAAQSAPHIPINVQALNCDFLVFSAHKMYGPTGLGILYGKEDLLNDLPPAEGGGEMIDHVTFEETTYNTLPYKFEAGTPDFIGTYAFHSAIDYINQNGKIAQISKHEAMLTEKLEQSLLEGNYSGASIKIYANDLHKAGVISFNLFNKDSKLIHPYDVGMLLDRQGVAVRTGHHCAEPLTHLLGVPGTVRASIAMYSDEDDIYSLIKAIEKAAAMLI